MRYRLVLAEGGQSYDLRDGTTLVVGRAPTSDVPIFDTTVSRRHAEVAMTGGVATVRDLGSSNGTFVNGLRIESHPLSGDDTVTFGKVVFRLVPVATPLGTPKVDTPRPAGATIVRQLAGRESGTKLGIVASPSGSMTAINMPAALTPEEAARQKLGILLEVSKALSRALDVDQILEKIVDFATQLLDTDRVAILLLDGAGALAPKIARDRRGSSAERHVPRSIAQKAVDDKVAILTDNAFEDDRFGGQSILIQQIRSAICVPLIGSEDRALGVLYVDNLTATHRFSEEDLDFLIAFSGIAAVAIENSQFAERIRRELLVRSNFERYFAPQLAERIASSPEAMRLGGDKRTVTVLFSDIRGFTALSETMKPDDMASLLTEYFTEMVDCVFRCGGTLDKFIGDAVMAQWGAPIGTNDDADRAIQAATEMMRALERLNAGWVAQGRPQLAIGIGLNHGEAFAGNIGSERRLEFTVIGDVVNTASRLCSAAGPGEILISDEMRRALATVPPLDECPPMDLKGKAQPVPVYRVGW